MELLAEQPAEHSDFETESDGETEKEERMYDETLPYLMYGRYLLYLLEILGNDGVGERCMIS